MFNNKRIGNQLVVCLHEETQHSNESQWLRIVLLNMDEFYRLCSGRGGRQVGKRLHVPVIPLYKVKNMRKTLRVV